MSSNQPPTDPIQQVINSVQNPADGFPLEVAIPGTPNVFRGNTPQEVLNQLVQAQANASQEIQRQRAENAHVRQEMEGLRAQIPPPPPPNASEVEKEAYYKTWASDPDKAFDIQLARRLNTTPERVQEVLRSAVEKTTVNSAADEFLGRCQDYPQSNPQAAQMMRDRLAQRFGNGPEATTADNLEVVYHELVRNGQIQPNAVPIQGQAQQNVVMPNMRGTGSQQAPPTLDIMRQAWAMPLDKLKQVIDTANSR